MLNQNLLNAKRIEKGYTVEQVANVIGINTITLYRKINGKSEFLRSEIQQIRMLFKLTDNELMSIFFAV